MWNWLNFIKNLYFFFKNEKKDTNLIILCIQMSVGFFHKKIQNRKQSFFFNLFNTFYEMIWFEGFSFGDGGCISLTLYYLVVMQKIEFWSLIFKRIQEKARISFSVIINGLSYQILIISVERIFIFKSFVDLIYLKFIQNTRQNYVFLKKYIKD